MSGYCGGTSADDILRLRRMVAEPSATTYTDALLAATIERYPVPDEFGIWPDEAGWLALYDHALAAAEIWSEKATIMAANFDFDADGASFKRSQQYEQFMKQARRWRSLRVPGNYTVVPAAPAEAALPDIGPQGPGRLLFNTPEASGLVAVL